MAGKKGRLVPGSIGQGDAPEKGVPWAQGSPVHAGRQAEGARARPAGADTAGRPPGAQGCGAGARGTGGHESKAKCRM
ncbi:hypothetical protein DESPIGER_1042 [Desulfovibrio piger]|uniref:Uncharacterized protein n=1 Tax=Desulfovibrio piger TaxID=901 RepID=A0A1K1LDV3_9BACT|nr:hypothetical protein DESPIGER_1042 [Desulfovibrio piger]